MKHYLHILLVALMAIMLLSSCMSKEERALDRLQTMVEKIEKNGDSLTSEQWEQLYKDYSDLHAKIVSDDYHFTDEQTRELGRLDGKLGKAFVKHSMNDFGKAAGDFIKKGSEFLKGVLDSDDEQND